MSFRTSLLALAALLVWTPAASAELELVSKRHPSFPPSDTARGGYFGGFFSGVSISADGRYAVFSSHAINLVEGQEDGNKEHDVFLRDLLTGTTTLVSRSAASPARTGNNRSLEPVVSADGRYVAFQSLATDLVPGQTDGNGTRDLFLYDRVTGTTTLVSRNAASATDTGNGESFQPAVSADGAYVAFVSSSTDLAPGQVDTNGGYDTFLFDRAAGTVALVSHTHTSSTTTGDGASPQWVGLPTLLSADGRFVAFESYATNLVSGVTDASGATDAFLYDRTTGTVTHLSRSASNPASAANSSSSPVSISDDGGRIVIRSWATDLAGGLTDGNDTLDIFVHERSTGAVSLVSRSSASSTATGNGASAFARISGDGSRVVLQSTAMDMIPGGTPTSLSQIFLYNLDTGTMTLVSRSASSPTTGGNLDSFDPWIAADGTRVAFGSWATDLVAGQVDSLFAVTEDAFFYDAGSGDLTLVSRSAASSVTALGAVDISLSAGGGHLIFWSWSDALAPDVADTDKWSDVFVYSAAGDSIATVSVRHPDLPSITSAGDSRLEALSADGRFVAFSSTADQLVPGQVPVDDEGGFIFAAGYVFLHDRLLGTTILVSHAAGAPSTPSNAAARSQALSASGNFVLFQSNATDLVPGASDTNNANDLFLWERATGTTTLVSHAAGSPGTAADNNSLVGSLSADGRYIALQSDASNLVPGFTQAGFGSNAYLVDRTAGTTTLISGVEGSSTTGAENSFAVTISAAGRYVAFESWAVNLIPGQQDHATNDVFLYDRVSGTTQLVSHAAGFATRTGNSASNFSDLSADGRYVAFQSLATDLVSGFTGDNMNAYVFDRVSGATQLVSRTSASATEGAGGFFPRISADGRFLVFTSSGDNLVPGQVGPATFMSHVYLFDRLLGTTTLVSHAAGAPITTANGTCQNPRISADGRFVSFSSQATDLIPGQTGPAGQYNSFVYDRITGATRLVSGAGGSPTQGGNNGSGTPLLSADGSVLAFASGASDLVDGDYLGGADLFVSATPPAGADFFTFTPCRVLDTRSGAALSSGVPRRVTLTGTCGIPGTARIVAVNITAIGPTGNGRLTVYPGYLEPTGTSTLSFQTGVIRANNALLPLALNGTGTLTLEPLVVGGGTVHATVDVTGYFE